jgi:hypothetical protein
MATTDTKLTDAELDIAVGQLLRLNRQIIRAGKHLGNRGQICGRPKEPGLERGYRCEYCGHDDWGGQGGRVCKECRRRYAFARQWDKPRPPIGRCPVRKDARTPEEVRQGVARYGKAVQMRLRARELEMKRDAYGLAFGADALAQASNQRVSAWFHDHFRP